MRRTLGFLALLLPARGAPAQGPIASVDHLVGWCAPPPAAVLGQIDIQDFLNCLPAKTVCGPALGVPAAVYAGGTAYDPRNQSVWASDGQVLVEYALNGCKGLCKQLPTFVAPMGSVVRGLAISDAQSLLFQLETQPGHLGIVVYDNKACPPQPIGQCRLPLGQRELAGGLAYDAPRNLLYYTVSTPGVAGWSSVVMVASAKDPCNPLCKWPLPATCTGMSFITGLAYSACRRSLYATDGNATFQIFAVDPLKCEFSPGACCKKQTPGEYLGLDFVPGWRSASVGKNCTGKPCPDCPAMAIGTVGGDPSLGNPSFGIEISGAPAGSVGLLFLAPGGCGNGFQFPFLCGPVFPLPAALVVGVPLPGGMLPCSGAGQVPLAIPPSIALCGGVLCAQWVVVCQTPVASGFGLTAALQFTLASS